MCTVTFIKTNTEIYITSNRDEQTSRPLALLPEVYEMENGKMLYPKDAKAGGTWIALHNNGNAMVLFNGATKRHIPTPPYRKSRGLIFLEIFNNLTPITYFENIDLTEIEPFTLVIWQQGKLHEAQWNGMSKSVENIDEAIPHIWSSVTLYDEEIIKLREQWFKEWLTKNKTITPEGIRNFHEFGGNADDTINLKMNRKGIFKTVSITNILINREKATFHYSDLLQGVKSVHEWYLYPYDLNL